MGEMADYYLESEPDDWEDEAGTTCRYCSEGNLWWEETSKGWRLFNEDGIVHTCKQYTKEQYVNNDPEC